MWGWINGAYSYSLCVCVSLSLLSPLPSPPAPSPSLPAPLSLTCWNKHTNCITRFPGLTFGSRKRVRFEHVSVIRGGKVISYTQLDCVYKGPRRQVYLFCFIKQLNQTVSALLTGLTEQIFADWLIHQTTGQFSSTSFLLSGKPRKEK